MPREGWAVSALVLEIVLFIQFECPQVNWQQMSQSSKKRIADSDQGLGSQGRPPNHQKRKRQKMIAEANNMAKVIDYFEPPRNHLLTSILKSLDKQLPGHCQIGIWPRDPRMLARNHLPTLLKMLQMDNSDASLHEATMNINTRRNHKTEIVIENPETKRTQLVKKDQFPILLSPQDMCFYQMPYELFLEKFSAGPLSREELTRAFQHLVMPSENPLEMGEIIWPALSFSPLNYSLEQVLEMVSNFPIGDEGTFNFLRKVSSLPQNSLNIPENSLNLPKNNSMKSQSDIKADGSQFNEDLSEKRDFLRVPDPKGDLSDFDRKSNIQRGDDAIDEEIDNEARESVTPILYDFSKERSFGQLEDSSDCKPFPSVALEKNLCIWLFGTSMFMSTNKNIVSWNSFGPKKIQKLIKNTKFSLIVEEINTFIDCLNQQKKYAHAQPRVDEYKAFLYRLGEFKEDEQLYNCMALRFQNGKGSSNKKILIKIFKQETTELRWVPMEAVSLNYTYPNLTKNETALNYLVKKIPPLKLLESFIFRQFFYMPLDITEIFLSYYPRFFIQQEEAANQRCESCRYIIRKETFQCCFFCKNFYHDSCAITRDTYFVARPSVFPQNETIWICEQCQPCFICNEAVGPKFFKCSVCKNYLHDICGRLRGIEEDSLDLNELGDKFVCESCLKCRMCARKLRDSDYELKDKDFFCVECSQIVKSNDHCHICMKNKKDWKWTQCDNGQCQKWIHDACDMEYQNYFKGNKDRYLCPMCRLSLKRKVYCELILFISQFDEFQFFTEPSYDKIPFYHQVISHPMCFSKMKEFAEQGAYDEDPYKSTESDFQLIVKNALEFNMPKDSAHFQAKILKIMGQLALERLRQCFTPNLGELLTGEIFTKIKDIKREFYHYIYEHYPEILINYRSNKSYIEIKKRPMAISNPDSLVFNSHYILNTMYKNASVIFHLKKQKVKIANLFTMPKNENDRGIWSPIKGDQCYYHDNSDVIFWCDQCCESFCCMSECLKHRLCSCGTRGCKCDSYECGCPALKDKEKKLLETKILQKFPDPIKTARDILMDVTENYKYCLKCVSEKPINRNCCICLGLCSWGYSGCPKCQRVWHKACNTYPLPNTYIPMPSGAMDGNSISPSATCSLQLCKQCLETNEYLNTYEQCLTLQSKARLIKMEKVHRYLRFFSEIYFHEGIRMTLYQIQLLILDNYDQFSIREQLFKDYELNYFIMERFRDVIFKTNAAIERSFAEYMNDYLEVRKKKNNIVETPKLRKIMGNNFCSIMQEIEHQESTYVPFCLQDSFEHLNNCKRIWWNMMKYQHLDVGEVDVEKFHNWKNAPDLECRNRRFILPKIKAVRNKIIEKAYAYEDFNSFRYSHFDKKQQIISFIDPNNSYTQEQSDTDMASESPFHPDFSSRKEYRSYLQSLSYIPTLTEAFFKKQHHHRFTICYKPRIMPYEYKLNPMFKKKHQLATEIKKFLLGIYEESKYCLRKGSTCILRHEKDHWEILKRWAKGTKKLHISLERKREMWELTVNSKRMIVAEIEDIIHEINKVIDHGGKQERKIHTFKDLGQFLGFTIYEPFYKANHYTNFLQTNLVDEMPLLEKMKKVTDLYNSFEWEENGIFSKFGLADPTREESDKNRVIRYEYNMTKIKPYFLTKRKKAAKPQVKKNQSMAEEDTNTHHHTNSKKPFITFEDLRKNLDESSQYGIPVSTQKSEVSIKNLPVLNQVFIAPSKIHKLGLFARKSVKKHTIMIEYIGETVSESVADKREERFHYGCYMFGLGKHIQEKKDIIDATFRGNMARYLNHSCDPNCKAKTEFLAGIPRIFIYTIRDVDQFEQLTYDYQFNVDGDEKLECTCGAKNCQGRLN